MPFNGLRHLRPSGRTTPRPGSTAGLAPAPSRGRHGRQPAATLEIDRDASACLPAAVDIFPIEAFQAQARDAVDGPRFYAALSESGNQYGSRFQKVASIWRAGDRSLGRLD